MVFESIYSARSVENKPQKMLIISVIMTFISTFVSYMIYPAYAGIMTPLFVTIGIAPLIIKVFQLEEETDRLYAEHRINETFWQRHGEVIWVFTMFFIGSFISYFIFAAFFSEGFVSTVFAPQINEITAIHSMAATGSHVTSYILEAIVLNNLKVMTTSFILSLIFGSGALFILNWNASVLAVYLGNFVRQSQFSEFISTSIGIIPHAPVEISAYFFAGIAGGMLSAGLIREHIKSKEFAIVFRDALLMLGLGIAFVIAGAFIEVYL